MKENVEVVPISTLCVLKLEERENPAHIELRHKFTETCEIGLGMKATLDEFMPDKLNPELELYTDDDGKTGTDDASPEELEPTPEANSNYVNNDIMLPLWKRNVQ